MLLTSLNSQDRCAGLTGNVVFSQTFIRLCHLGYFPEIGADVSLESHIVVNARRLIFFLGDQVLGALGKGDPLIGGIMDLKGMTHPFLCGCLVIFIPRIIAAPVRRRLIHLGSFEPERKPSPDHRCIPSL